MLGARYHVASVERDMVSNLIICPVSLGFFVVRECFSEHGIFYVEYVTSMLTDTKLRNLKPKEKLYKVNDRDGLYVAVTPRRFNLLSLQLLHQRPSGDRYVRSLWRGRHHTCGS